jgi:hypothetical protein
MYSLGRRDVAGISGPGGHPYTFVGDSRWSKKSSACEPHHVSLGVDTSQLRASTEINVSTSSSILSGSQEPSLPAGGTSCRDESSGVPSGRASKSSQWLQTHCPFYASVTKALTTAPPAPPINLLPAPTPASLPTATPQPSSHNRRVSIKKRWRSQAPQGLKRKF